MKKLLLPLLLALGPAAAFAHQTAPPVAAPAATHLVSGRVLDEHGQPISGATVVLKGTLLDTSTDRNGYYELACVPANGRLRFSFVGSITQELPVPPAGQLLNVVLQETHEQPPKGMVIGHGTSRPAAKARTGRVAGPPSAAPRTLRRVEVAD